MTPLQYGFLVGIFCCFTVLEFWMGRAQRFHASRADNILDGLGFLLLAVFSQPLILWLSSQLAHAVVPQYQNALVDLPWYAQLGLLLVFDDMLQYWWHRASHSPLLWPLHRAHHTAHYMSARIIYRNNFSTTSLCQPYGARAFWCIWVWAPPTLFTLSSSWG